MSTSSAVGCVGDGEGRLTATLVGVEIGLLCVRFLFSDVKGDSRDVTSAKLIPKTIMIPTTSALFKSFTLFGDRIVSAISNLIRDF